MVNTTIRQRCKVYDLQLTTRITFFALEPQPLSWGRVALDLAWRKEPNAWLDVQLKMQDM